MRVELALAHREMSVPVAHVDLDDDEERLVLASFDPIGAMAHADEEKALGEHRLSVNTACCAAMLQRRPTCKGSTGWTPQPVVLAGDSRGGLEDPRGARLG